MNLREITLTKYSPGGGLLYLGTSGSYGNEALKLIRGDGWEDVVITATFSGCGDPVQVLPDADDVVAVPAEATAKAISRSTPGAIVFAGYKDGAKVISTNLAYYVDGHAAVEGDTPAPPTPSQYEQLMGALAGKEDNANKVQLVTEPNADDYPSTAAMAQYVATHGGGGDVTKDAIVQALGYTPVNNIHLWSDGSAVFFFDDRDTQENPLTYLQVKEIVENDENSVFLSNGYYSFYSKYLYTPGIAGENAIGFVGETQLDREDGKRVYSFIIAIHDDDSVTVSEVRLAKYSDLEKKADLVSLTITAKGTDGSLLPTGTIKVYNDLNGGLMYTIEYTGEPFVLRLPVGFAYKITMLENVEGYYNPVPVSGIATEDAQITIMWSVLGIIETWADVQKVVQLGLGDKYFKTGDALETTYTDSNGAAFNFEWVVSDFKTVTVKLPDGSTEQRPGMRMIAKYATLESIVSDMPETDLATEETATEGLYYYGLSGSTYTLLNLAAGDTVPYGDYEHVYHNSVRDASFNILRYGYNRYDGSAFDQWLSSSAAKGEGWFTPSHVGQVAPGNSTTLQGFLHGFDDDFLNACGNVEIKQATNTVTDGGVTDVMYRKIYLPSVEEMFGAPQADGVEGEYLEAVKAGMATHTSRTNDADTGRIPYALENHASAQFARLRSAYRGNSYFAWYVNPLGTLSYSSAANACRALPACVIC